MIFNNGRTDVILFSAGIGCLFMIYLSGRDEGKNTSSLHPIKPVAASTLLKAISKKMMIQKVYYFQPISIAILLNVWFHLWCTHIFKCFISDPKATDPDETDTARIRSGPYRFPNNRNLSFCNNRSVSDLKVI